MHNNFTQNTLFILLIVLQLGQLHQLSAVKKVSQNQFKYPACDACRIYTASFKRGMSRTASGKFEGGDAAWEAEKLRKYAKSELRLVEIQEHVCSDVREGQDQCYSMNEQHEASVEDWWFNRIENEDPELFTYLCIDALQYCCPNDHYGPDCLPCEGYPDKICSNNGECKGAGSREGDGQCICRKEYSGDSCEHCREGYVEVRKDETRFWCAECHAACDGNCTGPGTGGCLKCADGWVYHEDGCIDLNECVVPVSPCSASKFCVNTVWSYYCLECDSSCSGCIGDGPDMCVNCAPGYKLKNNVCVHKGDENQDMYILLTRYFTYFGLCVIVYNAFYRDVAIAAVIGSLVAVYISVSEYFLLRPDFKETINKSFYDI